MCSYAFQHWVWWKCQANLIVTFLISLIVLSWKVTGKLYSFNLLSSKKRKNYFEWLIIIRYLSYWWITTLNEYYIPAWDHIFDSWDSAPTISNTGFLFWQFFTNHITWWVLSLNNTIYSECRIFVWKIKYSISHAISCVICRRRFFMRFQNILHISFWNIVICHAYTIHVGTGSKSFEI